MTIKNSPWGPVQIASDFGKPSVGSSVFVSTAGHGGIMISDDLHKDLQKVIDFDDSIRFKDQNQLYHCYEEDCAFALVLISMTLKGYFSFNKDQIESALISATRWYPGYCEKLNQILDNRSSDLSSDLIEQIREVRTNISSDLVKVSEARKNQVTSDKMREERDPDLIVSASRIDNYLELKRYLKVVPASEMLDERQQIADIQSALNREFDFIQGDSETLFGRGKVTAVITANDERYLVRNYNNLDLNLLSKCEKIAKIHG